MNFTSFLANKYFEFLLKCGPSQDKKQVYPAPPSSSGPSPSSQFLFAPPWAQSAEVFISLCDGCGDCLAACENNILVRGRDGYPQVDFSRGSCNFCGACAKSCSKGAFRFVPSSPPWHLHAFVTVNCLMNNKVLCSTCVEQCDKKAIIFPKAIHKDQTPEILAAKCDGCGACFASCPVGAIAFKNNGHQAKP